MINLGETLNEMRKDRGITLLELSKIAHVSLSYISLIENGKRVPRVDVLDKLFAGIGCKMIIEIKEGG